MISPKIVGELKNPQQIANPPHDSFLPTKQAEDKHNVPALRKKGFLHVAHELYLDIYPKQV